MDISDGTQTDLTLTLASTATDSSNIPLEEVYYMGIIDILQPYNFRKRLEHAIKSVVPGKAEGISCVDPTTYAERFRSFLAYVLAGMHGCRVCAVTSECVLTQASGTGARSRRWCPSRLSCRPTTFSPRRRLIPSCSARPPTPRVLYASNARGSRVILPSCR